MSDEFDLPGAVYMCSYDMKGAGIFLFKMMWLLATIWEVLVLCLAIWIAVKHFRGRQRAPTRWTVKGCFAVLIKTHVFYFVR